MPGAKPSGGRRLVIVESPAKAKTIAGYLGDDYMVESSIGHIRDLPHSAAEVPEEQKKEPWARLGVNVDSDFEPLYVVDPKKKKVVTSLRAKIRTPTSSARDGRGSRGRGDRLAPVQVLKPKVPVRRMVFHEITKGAIQRAIDETREIDDRLVDAQETRRILDRLYGYEVSPVLWRKVMKGLSAGRVQSVATRLVVERERQRMAFVAAEYWDIAGTFAARPSSRASSPPSTATASLRAGTSPATASSPTPKRCSSTRRRHAGSPTRSTARRSRFARSSDARTRAGRPRRS